MYDIYPVILMSLSNTYPSLRKKIKIKELGLKNKALYCLMSIMADLEKKVKV
jgi:hypothetical protein